MLSLSHAGVEVRQNENRRGISAAGRCGAACGGVCLPRNGPRLGPRRYLHAAARQTQHGGRNALPPLSGRKLRPADDCRLQLLRRPLPQRNSHRTPLPRFAAQPLVRRRFAAAAPARQHRTAAERQGAPHGGAAPLDTLGRNRQPARRQHRTAPRAARHARRRRLDARPAARAERHRRGHRRHTPSQAPLPPPHRRHLQPPEGGLDARHFATRGGRLAPPGRRAAGHHRRGAPPAAGQGDQPAARHLRQGVGRRAAPACEQRTGRRQNLPPHTRLRGGGDRLPARPHRAQRGAAQTQHPAARRHRLVGRRPHAALRGHSLARRQPQQPIQTPARTGRPRKGRPARCPRKADAGRHARHQGPARSHHGLYRTARKAHHRRTGPPLSGAHHPLVGASARADAQPARLLPARHPQDGAQRGALHPRAALRGHPRGLCRPGRGQGAEPDAPHDARMPPRGDGRRRTHPPGGRQPALERPEVHRLGQCGHLARTRRRAAALLGA